MQKGPPRKSLAERRVPDLFQVRLGIEYHELLLAIAERQYRNPTDLLKMWIDEHAEECGFVPISARAYLKPTECHQ